MDNPNKTKLKMLCLLLVVTCLPCAGAVSDNETVVVKSGENGTLRVEKPGLGNATVVTLKKNCQDGTEEEIYCSPDEKNRGCTTNKSEKLSLMMDADSFSIILVDARASDEGCYLVAHVDIANVVTKRTFIVKVHEPVTEREAAAVPSQDPTPDVAEDVSQEPVTEREAVVLSQDPVSKVAKDVSQEQLPSTINPETSSISPFSTPPLSTKAFGTDGPTTTVSTERNGEVSWKIKVSIVASIVGIIAVIFGIIYYKKKKQNNAGAGADADADADDNAEDPGERIPLKPKTNTGGGEPSEFVVDKPLHGA